MVATRGPVPKRSTERRRTNKTGMETTAAMAGQVRVPSCPPHLHDVAKRWYRSLRQSGEAQFYEPSDWAAALYVAEAMSRNLEQEKRFSAQLFGVVWNAMNDLLTTEQARRRARIEVERALAEPESDTPTALDEYRARLA